MTKIALAQAAGGENNPTERLEVAGRMAGEARRAGASLISFPEQFVTGWLPNLPPGSGEPLDGPLATAFARIAQENHIAVAAPIIEAGVDRRPRNTVAVFDESGELISVYAKIHLFSPEGEDRYYAAGDRIATFTIDGTKFGIAVCYDLRFPELFRAYALAGVECMLVPAAWPCSRLAHWEILLSARALENRYYVTGINTAGRPGTPCCGGSLAADPDGAIIGQCGAGEEVLTIGIDPAMVHDARRRIPSLSDCRSDLYHRLLSKL